MSQHTDRQNTKAASQPTKQSASNQIQLTISPQSDEKSRFSPGSVGTYSPGTILQLQRIIGNQATGRLIVDSKRANATKKVRSSADHVQELQRWPFSFGFMEQDAETKLGEKLKTDFPAGVKVAFYEKENTEAKRQAIEWAANENAIGIEKGGKVTADSLTFGKAFSDDLDMKTTLGELGNVLKSALAKAGGGADDDPAKIRVLAIFSHGAPDWLGIGKGGKDMGPNSAKALIKSTASSLTSDVNIILYACGTGQNPDDDDGWVKGTMKGGGASGLAGKIRDELAEQGLDQGSVWAHTTTGHPTRNFALREFKASEGKGAAGLAFAGETVFGGVERAQSAAGIMAEVISQGFILDKQWTRFWDLLHKQLEKVMYACYAKANDTLLFNGRNLAEMAPLHPLEVANLIQDFWNDTYWPSQKSKVVNYMIKKLKLKKKSP